MKKFIGVVVIILFFILIYLMSYYNIFSDRVVEVSALFIIFAFFILFESREMDAKTMAVVATLSSIAGVLRVPFAAIPGFQPVTFICAVSGYTLGPVNGFMIGAAAAFISNFFLGHGPWTMWQMLGWGLCGVFFGILRKPINRLGIKGFIILCGLWGYIYGIILDQWYIVQFMRPITIKSITAGIVLSFWNDTIHSIGNLIFAGLFGKNFITVLERYNKRNKVEYIE